MNCVYKLGYHVVFVVKYRRKILIDSLMDSYLKFLIKDICDSIGITLYNMKSDKDHIHMLLEMKPTHYIPRVMQILKGAISRNLRKTFDLSKPNKHSFLNPSYFICTMSENSRENIKKYIDN